MKLIFRLLATLLVLIVVAGVAIFFIPAEKIGGFAAEQFKKSTGRTLVLSGSLSPSFYPAIGVSTGPVEISNAEWSASGPMLKAKGMVIGVDISALIGGTVNIKNLHIKSPEITLEKSASGLANWVFASPSGTATDGDGGGAVAEIPDFNLPKARISNGKFTYIDHSSSQKFILSDLDMRLAAPGKTKPAALSVSGRVGGERIDLEIKLDTPAAALGGALSAVDLTLKSDFGDGHFRGKVSISPIAGVGDLELGITDLNSAMAVFGQAQAPELPKAARQLDFGGNITLASDGSLHLRESRLTTAGQTIKAEADLQMSTPPKLVAKIIADDLDLNPIGVSSGGGESGSATEASKGWSRTPIDLSFLGLLDGDLTFRANSLDLGTIRLGPTRLGAKLDKARLALSINEAGVYGGQLTGTIVANARSGFSTSADIQASNIDLQPFLKQFAEYDRLKGHANLKLKVLGFGADLNAVMNNLKGDGNLAIGKGEILGFDLAGMIRTLDTSYRGANDKTVFDGVTGSFTISDGVLNNDDLKFESPILDLAGLGQVGLGQQSVDYVVRATRFDGTSGLSDPALSVPVRIHGPWSDVNFTPDLENLVIGDLNKQVEEAGNAARKQLQDSVEEAIGEIPDEGTLEDKVEEALQNEAQKALQNLLGGGN